jgi:2-polyprenyl-3-methyl-5-hydroxy-6-metoxy-1,4-benzoquinol methylase
MHTKNLKKSVPFIEDKILKLLPKSKNVKILDIATGKGYLVYELENAGYKNIYTSDINKDQFVPSKGKYKFKVNDCNKNLSYKNNFFDVVISSETIEHLENPRFFMGEVKRILKVNGTFILTTPNVETVFSRIYFLLTGGLAGHTKSSYKVSGHIAVLPSWLIERFANELKFKLVTKTYNCGYIPVFRLKVKKMLLTRLFGWIYVYKFIKTK